MMRETITTDRLTLRQHTAEDAVNVTKGIGNFSVVRMLSGPPWPYELGHAEEWIAARPAERVTGRMLAYAITTAEDGLIGTISLSKMQRYEDVVPDAWELGYWVAEPFWGRGYATEAGRGILGAADQDLEGQPIVAAYFTDNPQSRHVLSKLGFVETGAIRQHFSPARNAQVDVQPMLRTPPYHMKEAEDAA